MEIKSDIEIAQSCEMKNIREIAATAGVDEKYLEMYGNYKAKVDYKLLNAVSYTHLLDGLGGADHGEHTAVVVAVGLGVEQGAAGHARGGLHEGVVSGLVLLLAAAEVRDTLYQSSHDKFLHNS